jgi:hypothetical protein
VLGKSLDVAIQNFTDTIQCDAVIVSHDKKDFYPAMIGYAFQVSLHLLWSFFLFHSFPFFGKHGFIFI